MFIKKRLIFWRLVFLRFWRQRGTEAVAILAYTTLVGLVPMLAVMLSLFSTSVWFEPFEHLVMQMVVAHLMPESQPVIQHYLALFAEQASRLATPGLVVMLATTLILLWTIDQKINAMWDGSLQRRWWVSLLNYLGVSLLGPLMLGLSLVASSYVIAWPLLLGDASLSWGVNQLMLSLPIIFSILGFMLLFKLVPMTHVSWSQAGWVAVMATVKIELLKMGFTWYIKAFPTYDLVYGALAAVPVFLLWLYLMWFILIWNACVLAQWTEGRQDEIKRT
ncbi:YihY family inner membrane protein [Thiomicrospira microaerophila]|uniref:YihY family inner membrane protein n=1 Tax=Thiomicrospira microaerophila TaxID=406020 RepID=UPI0005CA6E09|nr:YihY family inner membrane protein [Thiomicrospira microaerophila]